MSVRVVIAGGGVGGLETALALTTIAGDRVDITMVAPQRHFTYRPLSVNEPFGRGSALQVELSRVARDRGFGFVRDTLERVEPDGRVMVTQDGRRLPYDELVLALGAWPLAAVPGAVTFRGPRDSDRLKAALENVPEGGHVVFAVPPGNVWPLPAYELALLAADWFGERGRLVSIALHTAEAAALEAFGPRASQMVGELLLARGIRLRTGATARTDHLSDLVVAMPVLQGPAVPGLPCDREGFVPVDLYGRVRGEPHVHAVGDMTDHRLKQGGLAAQQADVVAADIAAAAGAPVEARRYEPELRGLLITGGRPLHLGRRRWPDHKIAGRHLAPYLATHAELMVPVHG